MTAKHKSEPFVLPFCRITESRYFCSSWFSDIKYLWDLFRANSAILCGTCILLNVLNLSKAYVSDCKKKIDKEFFQIKSTKWRSMLHQAHYQWQICYSDLSTSSSIIKFISINCKQDTVTKGELIHFSLFGAQVETVCQKNLGEQCNRKGIVLRFTNDHCMTVTVLGL